MSGTAASHAEPPGFNPQRPGYRIKNFTGVRLSNGELLKKRETRHLHRRRNLHVVSRICLLYEYRHPCVLHPSAGNSIEPRGAVLDRGEKARPTKSSPNADRTELVLMSWRFRPEKTGCLGQSGWRKADSSARQPQPKASGAFATCLSSAIDFSQETSRSRGENTKNEKTSFKRIRFLF